MSQEIIEETKPVNNDQDIGTVVEPETEDVKDSQLESAWSFWTSKKSKSFEESLRLIGSFNTIEGFWGSVSSIAT